MTRLHQPASPSVNGPLPSSHATATTPPPPPPPSSLPPPPLPGSSRRRKEQKQETRGYWCWLCVDWTPDPHARPYYTAPATEPDLIGDLRDRWHIWGAELLVLECGVPIVVAAIDETLWRLHDTRHQISSTAGTICSMARRMAKAARRPLSARR